MLRFEVERRIDHVKSIRNNFLKSIEKVVMVLSFILIVLTAFLVFTALLFVNHELWSAAQLSMKDFKMNVTFWIGLNAIAVSIFAFLGIHVAKKRSTHSCVLAFWGFGMLGVLAIPLLLESLAYI